MKVPPIFWVVLSAVLVVAYVLVSVNTARWDSVADFLNR
jgi:hypothetical protein